MLLTLQDGFSVRRKGGPVAMQEPVRGCDPARIVVWKEE